jgi:peptidoglycan/xylan/chitin deacetylase (PgdA/CDA1 family)
MISIVKRGSGLQREIALTFDDGPSPWTAAIAGAFERYACNATFFLSGPAAQKRPETVKALAAAGHELGNHLWSHSDSTTLTLEQLRSELERTADAVQEAGGPRPELVRPPYFKGPTAVAAAAAGCGVRAVVLRSIAVGDWKAASAEDIYDPVMKSAGPGDIVCLHDGISPDERDTDSREPTVEAVRRLIPALLERGLHPVTISGLLGDGRTPHD